MEFVGFVLLFSDKTSLVKVLSVFGLVLLDSLDSVLELVSAGNQKVLNGVLNSIDIDFSVLDVLVQGDDLAVVLSSSLLEIEFKLFKGIIQI